MSSVYTTAVSNVQYTEGIDERKMPFSGGSAVFVSRTGRTKDVTQIKGWREKFAPSESSESSSSSSFKPDGKLVHVIYGI